MEEFDDYCYSKKDLIGHGAFAIVYKGYCKSKKYDVAIKAIAKKNISKVKNLLNKEIQITKELSDLKHVNLVALLKCVESPTHVFLVMEYCNGGDLADYLNTYERISEPTIQHFFSQISKAIEAMNKKNVVHRDLKPQNILLCNPYKSSNTFNVSPKHLIVKLADFGFARELTEGRMAGTLCGSPMYMAPEVIMSHQYSAKADLWSIGTIMYQCLTGKAPFIAQTPQQLKSKYEMSKELCPKIPNFCSAPLSDLLYKLLKKDPKERIEFIDFFLHPFLHISLNSLTTPLTSQIQYRQESGCSLSNAYIHARFTEPSLNITGDSNNSTKKNSYHLPQETTTNNPIGVVTRYKSLANNNTHLSKIPNDRTRQAPLRPLFLSPNVQRTNFKLSSNESNFPQHTYNNINKTKEKKPVSLIKQNFSDGGKLANTITFQSRSNLRSNMLESNDFTFLPPLDKAGEEAHRLQFDYFSTHKNQMQFSSSSSTTTAISNDNILIDQVNSSKVFDRGEPVPSQRLVYAQMQERRKITVASPVSHVAVTATSFACNKKRIPSVEELNLPETQFVLHKLPKPNQKNFYGVLSYFNYGAEIFTKKTSSIPKSVTCSDLINPITFNTASLTTGITSVDNNKKFSSPSSTKIDNLALITDNLKDNSQLQTIDKNSKIFDTDTITIDNLTIKNLQNNELKNENEENVEPLTVFFSPRDIDKVENKSLISQETFNLTKIDNFSNDDKQLLDGIDHLNISDNNFSKSNLNSNKYDHKSIKKEANLTDLFFNTEPPPELEAETILDVEHCKILAKLKFVLELIEALINVAEKKTNLMAMIIDNGAKKSCHQSYAASDASRRAEQLVLYVRSLHILSSALVMAQRQINAETLKPSPAVQNILNQLNEKYHQCLTRSQELTLLGIPGSDSTMTVVSAERIMYQHAIDLCQSAALDELFGHPQLCPKRYQTAYMMLHTLFEQVQNEQDKSVLAKYKNAIEKRMQILEQQGFVTAVNLNKQTSLNHYHSHNKDILKK